MSDGSPVEVSVVVPCYRAGRWLARFAESLKAQTYAGRWEAVFVDDGDPDAATAYAALEGEPRFRLVHRPNGGVSSARNTGIENAKGEMLLFADPDDEPRPDWIANLVRAIDGVDFAWGGFLMRDGGGRIATFIPKDADAVYEGPDVRRRVWRAVFGYRLRDVLVHPTRAGLWRACGREFGTVWCRAFRRSVMGDLRFDEALPLNEDAIFLSEYALRARTMRVAGVADYVYDVRQDGAAAVGNGAGKSRNKFLLRDARARLDPGRRHWLGTFFLSALEVLLDSGARQAWRYIRGLPVDNL